MLRLLIASGLATLLVDPSAMARADPPRVICGSYGTGAECGQTAEVELRGRSASTSGRQAVDPDYVSFPYVVRAGDPGTCTTHNGIDRTCSPDGRDLPPGTPDCIRAQGLGHAPSLREFARQQWEEVSANYRMCPSTGSEAELDPVVIAIRAWQHIPLPRPSPHIAPGWAITGKYA